MSEFDGKKFYGFSLHNDPVLSTTTRNFEFKYTRPEHLERAIQKVQHSEAGHDVHRKKDIFNRLCKAKKIVTASDVNTPYCRDADVETLVSRCDANGRVRNLSDIEINQLIGKVKSYGDLRKQNSSDTYARAKDTSKTVNKPTILKGILRPKTYEFPSGGNISNVYHCGSRASHLGDACADDDENGDGDTLCSEPTSDDQILCNPFDMPHETLFETHTLHMPHMRRELHSGLGKLPDVPEEDELLASKTVMPMIVEEIRKPEPRWVEIFEAPAKVPAQLEEIKMQIDHKAATVVGKESSSGKTDRLPTNVTYTMHSHELQLPLQISAPEMMLKNQPPPNSLPNMSICYQQSSYDDNASTYDVEDSDLEYEMMGRAEYTKLCGPRPKTIEELTNKSNNSGGLAQFVEVEPQFDSLNLSFLKNISPIRYSDMTDDRDEDKPADINQEMKVFIKNHGKKSPSASPEKEAKPTSPVREVKKKITKARKKPVEEVKANPHKKLSARGADSSPAANGKSPHTTPRTSGRKSTPTTPKQHKDRKSQNISSNELRAMKNIILTKSIEDLKMEKMTLFAKMTSMQERIIETLDKLRMSLLELYVPDSHYEKTKRQKNAFEFSVRFSRNFLYPLKGMIEDLRLVSVEQLCSASSNEATQRVLNIFSLIHQSLQTYYKQLRYFLLDQVPQKLNTLIELAATTVNICLEKQIFDRNDAIIECLQDRCTKFLGFLEGMHEERFLTARDNYRKSSFDKTASNYSLKMFMNDLNMYEPKLVPKNHYNHRRKPKQRRVLKPSATNINIKTKTKINTTPVTPKTSHMVITKPDGDQISTQINDLANSSGIFHSVADKSMPPAEPSMNSEDQPNLNKALVEALQTVTKEQMRQVLQPIMQTLGTVLEKKNASKTIEELLNAFGNNLISLAEGESLRRSSPEKHSANRDKVYESEESKAAKQTECQQRNQHRHSNDESTKRHEAAGAGNFFGEASGANVTETVIRNIVLDDDDDDNYYADDGFENSVGDYVDEDDDGGDVGVDSRIGKAKRAQIEPTEPAELSEPAKLTETAQTNDSVRYFRDECGDKRNKKSKNYKACNSETAFDHFRLSECSAGDKRGDYDGEDAVSESGSDFVSFEGNSSSFDVADKSKVKEEQQAQHHRQQQQQQQQQLYANKRQQQQHKRDQQQMEIFEARDQPYEHKQHKQQQQQLEVQEEKALRARTENYDTHIKQQEQLLLQQAYEEEMLQCHQKKHNAARQNPGNKNTTAQIIKQSRNLQKQLEQQLEEHQRCIIAQQQQLQLHQKQLHQHKLFEREEQRMLQEQQQMQAQVTPQKPLTRKQLQMQARHSSRTSTSRQPTTRQSPSIPTNRSRLNTRGRNLSSNRAEIHASEKGTKALKKRRNPLNSPPPVPSVTPSNSARTPLLNANCDTSNGGARIPPSSFTQIKTPSVRSSFTAADMCYAEDVASGAGGDAAAAALNAPTCSQAEILQMCTKLKSNLFDMMVPLTNAFTIASGGGGAGKEEQRSPRQTKQSKPSLKKMGAFANHDLIDALTNCLFNSAGQNNSAKGAGNTTVREDGDAICDTNTETSNPVTLYTGESPYEKMKLKKAEQRLLKQYQKQQKREGRKRDECQDSNKEETNDWIDENSGEEIIDANDPDCKPPVETQEDEMKSRALETVVSPCALFNASPSQATNQKKDLHIEQLIAERNQFLHLCSKNRFYANPNFNQPWSVFSKLAQRLSDDIVSVIEEDFSIGVSKFVQDFLDNETKI